MADINGAAALRAQYAIEIPKPTRRRQKKPPVEDAEAEAALEPLIDTTAALHLHSKKTSRLQKRHVRKTESAAATAAATAATATTLTTLPIEILITIAAYLEPSSVFRLSRTSTYLHSFVTLNASTLATRILSLRYSTLSRCFPLPFAFSAVPEDVRPALLSPRRQEMMGIHRKPYSHIPAFNPNTVCTCMTCVFAWNNLCLIIDLNHWQGHLEAREPIPIIARGSSPEWNQELLERNAGLVRRAMGDGLMYAAILERHLRTIVGTILRSARWRKKGEAKGRTRLYTLTDAEARGGFDTFLERAGPPSYEFLVWRDDYYTVSGQERSLESWSADRIAG